MIVGRLPEDLELFLNMPETVYVLRMNADGTDAEIEMRKIDVYPEYDRLLKQLMKAERPIKAGDVRAWGFGELMEEMTYHYDMGSCSPIGKPEDGEEVTLAVQYDLQVDTLKTRVLAKRIEMTLDKLGLERVADYSLRKEHIERGLAETRKTLQKYTESVDEAWRLLQDYIKGIEVSGVSLFRNKNIRRERSLENLNEWCSTFYMFYLFGKPFMKLVYRLGNRVRIDLIMTIYDVPCWEFDFMNGGLSVHRKNDLLSEKKSFDKWMKDAFKEPADATAIRVQLKGQIEQTLGANIADNEIFYDPVSECYLLNEDTERRLLGGMMPVKADDIDEIAKYTTFEGFVAILESGKIRMNSIVSMNDKTEADFLEDYIRSYKEEYEQEYDKYLFADKEFITSFTTRIDDLDMWRLYGDNARGVCMVFERDPKDEDELYKIKYLDPEKDELSKVNELMGALKEKGIRFRLNYLQKYRHFMKHSDYDSEEEYRLLVENDKPSGWFINRDNGILTPYVTRPIRKEGKPEVGDYPYRLKRIIVGPAMKEKIANLMQVFYYGHDCGYSLTVAESKIKSYR